MKKLPIFTYLGIFFISFLGSKNIQSQDLVINEFMASNDITIADEFGEYEDWVEIYNFGATDIDLAGYYLTDDLTNTSLWQVPYGSSSTIISAGGYLLFWFDKDLNQGPLHVNAKLSTSGEQVGLFAPDLTLIDTISFGQQTVDVSWGRIFDNATQWTAFLTATPSAENQTNLPAAEPPIFSQTTASLSNSFLLNISNPNPNSNIHFTIDGSTPTTTSPIYQSPISVDSSMTVRAIVSGNNFSASKIETEMYLINVSHAFPIVFAAFDPFDFYDPATGIYINYTQDWERPAKVALFEQDGTLAFNQPARVEIQGSASAIYPHKSLSFKAKKFDGKKQFKYPIFPDLPYTKYGSFNIRNSGQDWDKLHFRDAFISSLVGDLSDVGDIITKPNLILQGYRPAIGYFNGEYRGIYNIRERLDKRFFKTHFDLSTDEYDFIKDVDNAKVGNLDKWFEFMNFMSQNDMSIANNFDSLTKVMDVNSYMDYIILNVFINNHDWPGNNNRRYKEYDSNGRWRWLVYDLDFTYSLYNEGGMWNSGDFTNNALARLHNDQGWEWPNPEWSTRPFRACIQNNDWRTEFINRSADQLNVLFNPNRQQNRLDEFIERYTPEVQQHQCKWQECFNDWDVDIQIVRNFISGRTPVVREHYVQQYPEISGTTTLQLSANPIEGGSIEMSTLTLNETHFPWTGIYFSGVDIPVKAIASPGYEFVGWSNQDPSAATSINFFPGYYNLVANFQLISNDNCAPIEGFTDLGDFQGRSYYLSENMMTWTEAQSMASGLTGEMISINSQAENDFIQDVLAETVFIGLSDAISEGNPAWNDGAPLDFSNYADCNWCGINNDENDFGLLLNWDGKWAFNNQWVQRRFVLETDCNPTTTCPNTLPNYTNLGMFGGHQYYLSDAPLQWDDAKLQSEYLGGYLASMNTMEENNFIKASLGNNMAFIGFNDALSENSLVWANAEAITLDLSFNNTEINDYAVMNFWAGTWEMVNNMVVKNYIVEMDCPAPAPAPLLADAIPVIGVKLISLYPTPTDEIITARILSEKEEDVQIGIINAHGVVKQLILRNLQKGTNEISLNILDLPAGVYSLHITGARNNQALRFVKLD